MNDAAIRNATARLEAARSRVADLKRDQKRINELLARAQAEENEVKKFVDTWYELAGLERADSTEYGMDIVDRANARPDNPDRRDVAEEVVKLIRAAGRPMSRRELFEALPKRGITIRGRNAEMVFSTMLWRTKDLVVRLRPYGYWPADTDYPEAGYAAPDVGKLI